MESRIKEWTAQIEKLRGRAQVVEADARIKYHQEIRNLGTKIEVLGRKLEEIKKSSNEAWEVLKSGSEKAMSDFKQALDSARSRLKKTK